MASDWEEVTLGDFVDHQKGYIFKSRDYQDEGELIVRVSDFTDRSIDISSCNRIDKLRVNEFQSVRLNAFDVVIATVGSWPNNPASIVGKTVSVPKEAEGALLNQNAVRLRAVNKMEQRFLFFLLKDKAFQSYIVSTAQGSANQASITLRDIFRYSFKLPPLAAQKDIAHILGALDDKIELNRQMNETLEAMAQALFKSWFVDFDPVIDNALAAGNSIPDELFERAELRKAIKQNDSEDNQAIRSLFPDEFEFSEEMGWIPKGWEVTSLGEHINFQTGPVFKSADFSDAGVKLARGDNIKEGRFQWGDKTRYWLDIDESLTKYLLESGDMLIGMDGSKVGKNRTRVRESDLPCLLVQRVARLSKKNTICSNFIFLVINSQYFRDYVDVVKTGSAIPHISGGQIKELKLILPSDEKDPIFNKFEQLASSLIDRTDACVDNSLNLSKLRDILLPKLMSGEILIPDAAALVEDA